VPENPEIVPVILIVLVETLDSRLVKTDIESGLVVNDINDASIAIPFYNIE
jgi:hypothetical protein